MLALNLLIAQNETKFKRFSFETGVFIPINNLNTKLDVSPQFGFWYLTKVDHDDVLELGFLVTIPQGKEKFNWTGEDSIYQVKAKDIEFKVGAKMNKIYNTRRFIKSSSFAWTSGFGVSVLAFEDKENPNNDTGTYTNEKGEKYSVIDWNLKGLTSFYLSQGIGLQTNRFEVNLNYYYVPYNYFSDKIESDFGAHSLSFTMHYKL